MTALARFFRIGAAYFTDDAYYERLAQELTALAHLRDEAVRRITTRVIALSPAAREDVLAHADQLHRRDQQNDGDRPPPS